MILFPSDAQTLHAATQFVYATNIVVAKLEDLDRLVHKAEQ